jgi:hypothetical protein
VRCQSREESRGDLTSRFEVASGKGVWCAVGAKELALHLPALRDQGVPAEDGSFFSSFVRAQPALKFATKINFLLD